MKIKEEAILVNSLVLEFPILSSLMQDHLRSYDELLPHVFMGDFSRWVIDRFIQFGIADELLNKVLDFIETSFDSGNENVKELMAVSFLENLPHLGERGYKLRDYIGPSLKQELMRIDN